MKKPRGKKIIIISLYSLVLLAAGFLGGYLLKKNKELIDPKVLREDSTDYKFIDPVLLLQVPEDTTTPQFQSLKKSITDYITTAKSQNEASDISVYFRELNTDQWVGVNADDTYSPASMLKVVTLIAYLRAVQQDPSLYTKMITITTDDVNENVNQDYYPSTNPVQVGESYSAADLLSYMIINSDNTAANALDNEIGQAAFEQTLTDLQLPIPDQNGDDDFSPKMYSKILRSLYNGAFLSDAISDQALELMSKTTFTQGIVAGVPAGTTVAHKFGERTTTQGGQTIHELHDCGIVYDSKGPYLICIMTKGGDFTNLQKIVSDISAIAWKAAQQINISSTTGYDSKQ